MNSITRLEMRGRLGPRWSEPTHSRRNSRLRW